MFRAACVHASQVPFTDRFYSSHCPGLTKTQRGLLAADFQQYRDGHKLYINRRGRARVVPRRVAKKEAERDGAARSEGVGGGPGAVVEDGDEDGSVPIDAVAAELEPSIVLPPHGLLAPS